MEAAAAPSVYRGQPGPVAPAGAAWTCRRASSSRYRRPPTLRSGPTPPADRLRGTAEAAAAAGAVLQDEDDDDDASRRRFATY